MTPEPLVPKPPGVLARGLLVVAALSLTSCPHQLGLSQTSTKSAMRSLRRLKNRALAALIPYIGGRANIGGVSEKNFVDRTTGQLVDSSDADRSREPQILAPRYPGKAANRQPDPETAFVSAAVPPANVLPANVPPANVLPATVPPVNVPPVNVPSANAPSVNAPSVNAPSVNAPPADVRTTLPTDPASTAEDQPIATASDGLAHLPIHDPPPTNDPSIYSIGRETWIYAEPNYDSKRLGYLRFGSEVRRTSESAGRKGCAGGWFGVQPSGYVCVNGRTATADPAHPLLATRIEAPNRAAALPYAYTVARRGIPKFFGYLPTGNERPDASFSKRLLSGLGQPRPASVPDWLRSSHEIFGYRRPKDAARIGDGLIGGGIALLGVYSDANTLYGMTPDLELVTTDALEAAKPSTFAGKVLADNETLPVAVAMGKGSWLYHGDLRGGTLRPLRQLGRRELLTIEGGRITVQGQAWVQSKDGHWLRASNLRIVEPPTAWPDWAQPGQAWVDVSINQQTLVAYEGTRALFVTLVSTGVDGLLDPATTKSTKTGIFRIQSKHLTATMNGEAPEGAYEMREVPWVQYFSEGYALHGAYWHDGFGQPRSHGCINLSPADARWLFHFTNPGLPKNWHGAIPSEQSAIVSVHP